MTSQSTAFRTLAKRGYVHQCTDADGLDAALGSGPVVAYAGFDATADSLHVGHLLPIMTLRRLQAAGHKPVVLIGGGTTRVGDPSFRDASRPMLDEDAIAANVEGLRGAFSRYLSFGDGPTDAVMVDNAEWLDPLRHVDFLRDVGSHFTVARLLSLDGIRQRVERSQSMTLLELNYVVLQSYDFLELSRRMGCSLQVGGSDQWGNIVCGIELARKVDRRPLFGLTTPLLTTAAGTKMGKTASGRTAWLNADRLDPFGFWQFWRDVDDADVGRFLSLFTDLPDDEVARLSAMVGEGANVAKAVLADEATRLAHGPDAARDARATSEAAFSRGGVAAPGLPTVDVSFDDSDEGVPVYRLLVEAGLAASNGEARRAIAGGGVRLDDVKVGSPDAVVGPNDFGGDTLKLSLGRKRHATLRASGSSSRPGP